MECPLHPHLEKIKVIDMAREYRIVTDHFNGYEVQHRTWWLPFWRQTSIKSHPSIEAARDFISRDESYVVEYVGFLPTPTCGPENAGRTGHMSKATIEVREGWLVMEDRKYAADDALAEAVAKAISNARRNGEQGSYAAIDAIRAHDEASGMVLVPKEPSEDMLVAGNAAVRDLFEPPACLDLNQVYAAMIAEGGKHVA